MFNRFKKKLKTAGMHITPEEKAFDVVCGMELDPSRAELHAEYRGEIYYFCSKTCRDHFTNDPEKYSG